MSNYNLNDLISIGRKVGNGSVYTRLPLQTLLHAGNSEKLIYFDSTTIIGIVSKSGGKR